MSDIQKNWLLAVGYVGFIYATLGVVRAPISYLRSHGLLRISLGILYAACVVSLLAVLVKNKRSDIWRYVLLCAISFAYYFVAKWVQSPEEQIHFFQYGLVGVFFARALESHFHSTGKILFLALLLSTVAGWVDEILQGLMPNRHYDLRDVFLNFISALLGLIVYKTLLPSSFSLSPPLKS